MKSMTGAAFTSSARRAKSCSLLCCGVWVGAAKVPFVAGASVAVRPFCPSERGIAVRAGGMVVPVLERPAALPAWRSTASRTLTASLPLTDSRTFPSRRRTRKGTAVTSYSSEMSGSSSALTETKEMVGGVVTG